MNFHTEKTARAKDQLRIYFSIINWEYNKNTIADHLRNLSMIAKDADFHSRTIVASEYTSFNMIRFDAIQVIQDTRFSGNGSITYDENENQETKPSFIIGSSLDICFSLTGRVQVFLNPCKCDDSSKEHPTLLLFYTDRPLELTKDRLNHFFKDLMLYSRSTDVMCRLSIVDKLKLTIIILRDKLSRKTIYSPLNEFIYKQIIPLIAVTASCTTIIKFFWPQ